MFKFTYRVQSVDSGNFTTEFMNTECFEDGETLVAIVPFGDQAKIVTMKRLKIEPAEPTLVYNTIEIPEATDAIN